MLLLICYCERLKNFNWLEPQSSYMAMINKWKTAQLVNAAIALHSVIFKNLKYTIFYFNNKTTIERKNLMIR